MNSNSDNGFEAEFTSDDAIFLPTESTCCTLQ
jgi:hypothetical protein